MNVSKGRLFYLNIRESLLNQYPQSGNRTVAIKRDPFQGPRMGSCLTLRSELSEETRVDKARDFIGKGHPGGEQEGKGTQESCSAVWLAVSGFMVMGLVSGLPLANHSDSESFLVVHALFSQDGCQREGFSGPTRGVCF